MTIKIITDSSANLTLKSSNAYEFTVVPLTISVDQHHFVDNDNLDRGLFKAALAHTQEPAKTSCPNIAEWLHAYEGGDTIYVVTIFSALSGSYSAAQQAATIYQEEHPQAQVHVFDSLSAGPGLDLLIQKIAKLIEDEADFATVASQVTEYQAHTKLTFLLQSINNLATNGRVKPAIAKVVQFLKIGILGQADNQGEFAMAGKVRGQKKIATSILKQMLADGY